MLIAQTPDYYLEKERTKKVLLLGCYLVLNLLVFMCL